MRSCTDVMDCVSRGIAAQEHYEQFLSQSDPEKQNLKVRKTRDNIIKYIRAQKDATRVNEFARQLALIEIVSCKRTDVVQISIFKLLTAEVKRF